MAMYAKDVQCRFTYASPRFSRLIGRPAHSVLGRTWEEIGVPQPQAKFYEKADCKLISGLHDSYCDYEPSPFGPGAVWSSKSVVRGSDGRISGLVGVLIEGLPLARYHSQLALNSPAPFSAFGSADEHIRLGESHALLHIDFPYVPTVVELLSAMAAIHSAYAHIEFFLNATVTALQSIDSVVESDDPTSVIARVRFDSPGFFEILAKMNPLKIIVDHLEFRQKHEETIKLNKPKIAKLHADAIKAEMEANESAMKTELIRNKVIKERLTMLEQQGVPAEVRQKLLLRFVTSKLDIVGDYQEKGLIGVTTIVDNQSSDLGDDNGIED